MYAVTIILVFSYRIIVAKLILSSLGFAEFLTSSTIHLWMLKSSLLLLILERYVKEKQNLTSSFVRNVKELYTGYQSSGLPNSDEPRKLEDLKPQSVYLDSDRLSQYELPHPAALKYD